MNVLEFALTVVKENKESLNEGLKKVWNWSFYFAEVIKNVETNVVFKLSEEEAAKAVNLKKVKKQLSVVVPQTVKKKVGKTELEVAFKVTGVIADGEVKNAVLEVAVFFNNKKRILEVGKSVIDCSVLGEEGAKTAKEALTQVAKKLRVI